MLHVKSLVWLLGERVCSQFKLLKVTVRVKHRFSAWSPSGSWNIWNLFWVQLSPAAKTKCSSFFYTITWYYMGHNVMEFRTGKKRGHASAYYQIFALTMIQIFYELDNQVKHIVYFYKCKLMTFQMLCIYATYWDTFFLSLLVEWTELVIV